MEGEDVTSVQPIVFTSTGTNSSNLVFGIFRTIPGALWNNRLTMLSDRRFLVTYRSCTSTNSTNAPGGHHKDKCRCWLEWNILSRSSCIWIDVIFPSKEYQWVSFYSKRYWYFLLRFRWFKCVRGSAPDYPPLSLCIRFTLVFIFAVRALISTQRIFLHIQ